jgi:hypothetical protein
VDARRRSDGVALAALAALGAFALWWAWPAATVPLDLRAPEEADASTEPAAQEAAASEPEPAPVREAVAEAPAGLPAEPAAPDEIERPKPGEVALLGATWPTTTFATTPAWRCGGYAA